MNRIRKNTSRRTGAAAVEFALVVPLLFLFVFAAIEFSRANLLKNMAENAAMEGAREGILPGSTAEDCIARAEDFLAVMGLTNSSVTVDPPTLTPSTTEVTVTVSVPLADNSFTMARFAVGETLNQTVTLPREKQ